MQNQEFGRIQDVAILKNFLFNWGEHVGGGTFGDLLDEWKLHLENPRVLYLGYVYFGIVILGVLFSVVNKNKYAFALCLVTLFCLFFLLNNNWAFHYLQDRLVLFKEVFRLPFTKFSIFLMFAYASFFAFAVTSFGESIGRLFSKYKFISDTIIYSLIAFSLIYYASPMLSGYLISPSMRVNIPSRYFELFSYMDKQNEYGRVANLPINTFWGWVYHDWDSTDHTGYQGAGFLWFGIKQPLLDREFDRWDILNEQYYREMSTAIYSQDVAALQNVLEKYKIKWILLDKSVIAPGADEKSLFYKQTKELFGKSKLIFLEKDFGGGLSLFSYSGDFAREEVLETFIYSNDSVFKEHDDPIYKQYGNYVSVGKSNYPYLGITNFTENLKDAVVSSDDQYVYFANKTFDAELFANDNSVQFVVSIEGPLLKISSVQAGIVEEVPDIDISANIDVVVINGDLPITTGDSKTYTFSAKTSEPIKVSLYKLNDPRVSDYASIVERCSGVEGGSSYGIEYSTGGFNLTAKDIVSCVTLRLDTLMSETPKVLVIKADVSETEALAGICVFDEVTGLCRNRPYRDGSAVALLEQGSYLIRFLAYNVGKKTTSEGKVTFNNIQLFNSEQVSEKELNVIRTQNFKTGDKLAFKKDSAFSGEVVKLTSVPRLCNGGESNFEKSFVDSGSGQYIEYESNGESLCDSFQFPFAPHSSGHILEVTSRNLVGMPIRVCLTNEYSKRCDLYISLGENKDFETAYYMIPPMDDGKGYTVNISNLVFGEGKSVNDLKYIALTPISYSFFRSLHKEPTKSVGEKLLVLNEAYEKGWTVFCGYKLCDAQHTSVNNWSNGWIFKNGDVPLNARILFVPQLLQYLGFALFPLAFFRLIPQPHSH